MIPDGIDRDILAMPCYDAAAAAILFEQLMGEIDAYLGGAS